MPSFEQVNVLGHSSATPQCSLWQSLCPQEGEERVSMLATQAYEYIVVSIPSRSSETVGVLYSPRASVYTAQCCTYLGTDKVLLHGIDEECSIHTFLLELQNTRFSVSYLHTHSFHDSCVLNVVDTYVHSTEPANFPLVYKSNTLVCRTDTPVNVPSLAQLAVTGQLHGHHCLFLITDTCSLLYTIVDKVVTLVYILPHTLTYAQFWNDKLFVCSPSHVWTLEVPGLSVASLITGYAKSSNNNNKNLITEQLVILRYTHVGMTKGTSSSPLLGIYCSDTRIALLMSDGVQMALKPEVRTDFLGIADKLLGSTGKLVADSWVQTKVGTVPQGVLAGDGQHVCIYSTDFDRCRLFSVETLSHVKSFPIGKHADTYISVDNIGEQFALTTAQGQLNLFRTLGTPRLVETRPSSTSIAWAVYPFDPQIQQCPLGLVQILREEGVLTLLLRDEVKNTVHFLQSTQQGTKQRCVAVAKNHREEPGMYSFVIFVGSGDGDILMYTLYVEQQAPYTSTFAQKHTVQAHESAVRCVIWQEDQSRLGEVMKTCTCTGTCVSCPILHGSQVSGGDDSFVHVQSDTSILGPPVHSFSHHTGPVTSLHFLGPKVLCTTSTKAPSVCVVHMDDNYTQILKYVFHAHPVISARLHPSGKFLCLAYSNGYLSIVSTTTLSKHAEGLSYLKKYPLHQNDQEGDQLTFLPSLHSEDLLDSDESQGIGLTVDIHPSGQLIAVGQTNGSIRVYDWLTGAQVQRHLYSSAPASVAFSADGQQLYIGLAEGTVHVVKLPPSLHGRHVRNTIRRRTHETQLAKLQAAIPQKLEIEWLLKEYEYVASPTANVHQNTLDSQLEVVPTPLHGEQNEQVIKSKWKTPLQPEFLVQREGTGRNTRNTTQRLNATQRLIDQLNDHTSTNSNDSTNDNTSNNTNTNTLRRGFTGKCKGDVVLTTTPNNSSPSEQDELLVSGSMFGGTADNMFLLHSHPTNDTDDLSIAIEDVDHATYTHDDHYDADRITMEEEDAEEEYIFDFEDSTDHDNSNTKSNTNNTKSTPPTHLEHSDDDIQLFNSTIDSTDMLPTDTVTPIKLEISQARSVEVGFTRQPTVEVQQQDKVHVHFPTLVPESPKYSPKHVTISSIPKSNNNDNNSSNNDNNSNNHDDNDDNDDNNSNNSNNHDLPPMPRAKSSILPSLPICDVIPALRREHSGRQVLVVIHNNNDDDDDDMQIHFTPTSARRNTDDLVLVDKFNGIGGTIRYNGKDQQRELASMRDSTPHNTSTNNNNNSNTNTNNAYEEDIITRADSVSVATTSNNCKNRRSITDVNELLLETTSQSNSNSSFFMSESQSVLPNNQYHQDMSASLKQTDSQGIVRHIFSPSKQVLIEPRLQDDDEALLQEFMIDDLMDDMDNTSIIDGSRNSHIINSNNISEESEVEVNFHMTLESTMTAANTTTLNTTTLNTTTSNTTNNLNNVVIPRLQLPLSTTSTQDQATNHTLQDLLQNIQNLQIHDSSNEDTLNLTIQLLEATANLAVTALQTARTQRNNTQRSTDTLDKVVKQLHHELPLSNQPKLVLSDGGQLDIDLLAAKIAAQVRQSMN